MSLFALMSTCVIIWFYIVGVKTEPDLIYHNTTANQTEISVTGYTGWGQYRIEISGADVNWFEASTHCLNFGYASLVQCPNDYSRFSATQQFLRETLGSAANGTYWLGYFRPFPHVETWYDESCTASGPDVIFSGYDINELCSVAYFEGDYQKAATFKSENCYHRHSYICFKRLLKPTFHLYKGYEAEIPPNVKTIGIFENTTLDTCADKQGTNYLGPSFKYNHTSSQCVLYKLNTGYGYSNFNLTPTIDNVTYAVNIGSVFEFNQTTFATHTDAVYSLPGCSESVVPTNYYTCANANLNENCRELSETLVEEELEHTLQEIETNLTVDPESVSKHKRKYNNADDNRWSSATMGSIAVIIIVFSFSLPTISDVWNAVAKIQKTKVKKLRKTSKLR